MRGSCEFPEGVRGLDTCLKDVGRCGAPERLSVEVMKVGCRGVETINAYEVNLLELREQSEGHGG